MSLWRTGRAREGRKRDLEVTRKMDKCLLHFNWNNFCCIWNWYCSALDTPCNIQPQSKPGHFTHFFIRCLLFKCLCKHTQDSVLPSSLDFLILAIVTYTGSCRVMGVEPSSKFKMLPCPPNLKSKHCCFLTGPRLRPFYKDTEKSPSPRFNQFRLSPNLPSQESGFGDSLRYRNFSP